MDIHLINLDRDEDRLSTFTETNQHLNIVRFPAADGGAIPRTQLCADGVFSTEMPTYSDGAVGCALSHLSLWRKAAAQSEAFTIAEDDAILNIHFKAEASALVRSLPPDWDILLWGWNFDSILYFDFLPGVSPCLGVFSEPEMRKQAAVFQKLHVKPQAYRLQKAFGIPAYTVSPQGAEKLLKHCLPIRGMEVFFPGLNRFLPNSGIDVMMNALYPEINAFVSFPPLAVSKNEWTASTVNRQAEGAAKARGESAGIDKHGDTTAHDMKAREMKPDDAGAQIKLGNAFQGQGKLDDAMACYAKALELEPENVGAHINLGNVLQVRGKFDDAIAHYRAALNINPDQAAAHINLGNVLQAQGQFGDAIAHYKKALDINPRHAVVYNNLGGAILGSQGRLEDAGACFEQALVLKPDYPDAHHNLANVFYALGKLDHAVASYQRALALRPGRPDIYNKLGSTLKDQGKFGDAIACYKQALALDPNYAEAHYNLGNVLRAQGMLDGALECYERALLLKPAYADAHTNAILTLMDQGRLEDALACCGRALAFHPNSADTHFSEAYLRLLGGDFAEGWRKYEWRWFTKDAKPHGLTVPLWDGTDLRGRTILLHCEQGLGDAIQCVRFARLVKEKNGIVLLSCPPSLARVFQGVAGIDKIFPDGRGLPDYDVHAPMMSLPGLFRTALETIPNGVPYLQSDPERVNVWKDRLAGHRGFKVGIAWRGSAANKNDRNRSLTAAQFAEFLDIPGLVVVSLQKDGRAEEIETLRHLSGGFPGTFLDAGPLQEDFSDAAAWMANLDLIVSVDTSVCHLAGALAVPVWTLIPFIPDWRWLLQREDSPWYPTMRLFRQPKIGDWQSVVERVRAELASKAEAGFQAT